eukprot:502074-Pelagomonas_calceolata.AAC.1
MVGPVAVKLVLPETMRCHNAFHVSLIKPYKVPEGEEPNISTPLIEDDDEGEPAWKIEKIVNHRNSKTKKDFT